MNARILFALSFTAALALPVHAQFAIVVQQNGQASAVGNGAAIALNAPALGQSAVATVVVTYVGTATASFSSAGQVFGSNFTVTGDSAVTLSPFGSATFTLTYSPTSTSQAAGEFQWPYSEIASVNANGTTTTTTIATGIVSFNLIGTAPNVTVGQLTASGTFQSIPGGGSIQFPNTTVNAVSSVTVGVSNTGSGPATVDSITVTGAGYQIGSVPVLPLVINAGNQFNFTVQFQPASAGAAPGSLQITFASGGYMASLSGTGVTSLLMYNITQGGTTSPLNPGQTIAFGGTQVGGQSSAVIQFQNTGTAAVVLSVVAISGTGLAITDAPFLPVTLQPQQSNAITVTYTPVQVGSSTGRLQIGNDSFGITAQGTAPALTYSYQTGGTTSPVSPGQTITFGGTNVGSQSSAVIEFQNTGTAAVVLNTLGVTGVGFSITDGPFLPVTIQPQQSNSITVVYSPVQPGPSTGRLLIGTDSFVLSAQGLGPLLTFSYQIGGATLSVSPGGTISFPTVAEGQTASVQFSVTNTGNTAASVASIGIVDPTGTFTLPNPVAVPFQLSPAGVATFTINFSPLSEGNLAATLGINNEAFGLAGFATAPPPLPAYQFTGASGTQQPFQQPAVGLSLTSPYSIALSGTLTITIISSGFVADPAVQFSSGGQKVAFTIPANTLQAVFPNGATQIQLQSGTVAGAIRITPDFTVATANGTDITPANPVTLTLTVPSEAPALLAASISNQTLTGFSIVVSGFTTTRSLQNLTFQLTPASGYQLSATTFSMDLSAASTIFFAGAASQAVGGQFMITVPFTLTQSGSAATVNLATSISAVSVTATNATGTSNALQVTIP